MMGEGRQNAEAWRQAAQGQGQWDHALKNKEERETRQDTQQTQLF